MGDMYRGLSSINTLVLTWQWRHSTNMLYRNHGNRLVSYKANDYRWFYSFQYLKCCIVLTSDLRTFIQRSVLVSTPNFRHPKFVSKPENHNYVMNEILITFSQFSCEALGLYLKIDHDCIFLSSFKSSFTTVNLICMTFACENHH